MIASFCFTCSRRYSRLLTGECEYSSLSKEEGMRGGGVRHLGIGKTSGMGEEVRDRCRFKSTEVPQ
jgi:hypothetical protein